jgi:hippurate hydrolase
MGQMLEGLLPQVEEFVALRREIHRFPELAFEEHRTSALVAEKLALWGWEVHRGLGGTGVVGTLKRGTSPRRLGLRADMDALPIAETPGACTPAATTATPRCCWPRRASSPSTAASTARCT